MTLMRKLLRLVGGVAFALVAAAPVLAQAPTEQSAPTAAPAAASGGSYYIEFRVAQIGAYGHSYVMFGRLGASGKPATSQFADLHPMGNYAIMALGHVLPVPANTTWDPDVARLPIASSYRRKLSAAEYQKLLTAIKVANANKQPYWNAISNNCNHYVAQLARAIGLKTPHDFQVSYAFVPALRALNEGDQAKPQGVRADKPRKPSAVRTTTSAEAPRS